MTLDRAGAEHRSPEISEIEIGLLLAVSDVKDALGDSQAAFDLAQNAERLSRRFVEQYPGNEQFKHLLYASKYRIGDHFGANTHNEDSTRKAEAEYLVALDIAKELASNHPQDQAFQNDLAFILNKVGDIKQAKKDWQGAIEQYQAALKIAEAIAGAYPTGVATQKNRLAQIFSQRNQPGDQAMALANYREAIVILQRQLDSDPDDSTLISNIALAHRRIGGMLRNKPEEAQIEIEAAVMGRQKLYESDPGNRTWQTGLMTDYRLLGDVLVQKEEWGGALQNYNAAIQIARTIILRDPSNSGLQKTLAVLNVKRADTLVHRSNEMLIRPEPVVNQASRLIDDAVQGYRAAADTFEKGASPTEPALYADLFDVRIKIGDVLVRQHKYRDALDAYQLASKTAEQAASARRVVDWQIKLSVALEQAADFLASDAGADSSDDQPASSTGHDALLYYQTALAAIATAANKEPDNSALQSRRAALTAKIETQKSAAR